MKTSRTPKEMARLVEDIGPKSTKEYTMCISALGRSRQWERALSLLDEMRERGVTPDVISFSAAISACEKAGKWERVLSLLDEMRERGVAPNVISFSAAISACEKGGKWERVRTD